MMIIFYISIFSFEVFATEISNPIFTLVPKILWALDNLKLENLHSRDTSI